MKNKNIFGFIFLLIGCILLTLTFLFPRMILYGFTYGIAGGMLGCGFLMVLDFRKSNKENDKKNAKIKVNQNDERKIMLREKSGRTTYIICLVGLVIYNTTLFLLDKMGINIEIKFVIFTLSVYVIFEYILGILVFKHFGNKY